MRGPVIGLDPVGLAPGELLGAEGLHPAAEAQYYEWWEAEILPRVPAELRGFFEELIRYEFVTRPVHSARAEELDVEELGGAPFYKRGAQVFHWDFDQIIAALKEDPSTPCPPPSRWERVMYYRVGFERLVLNQEFPIDSFTAKPREAVAPAG